MKRQFNACQTPRSMYPSIFNSFPVIQTASANNRRFHVPQTHFCFPWRRPCDYHAICCMDGKTIQCLPIKTPRSKYLSMFNSFRVIRCLSQCVSPKIAIFTTFLFPLETPLRLSRNMLHIVRRYGVNQLHLESTSVFHMCKIFLPRDAMHKRGICRHAVSVRLSICLQRS